MAILGSMGNKKESMKKYQEFIPKSASEVKVSHDAKLGELAEKLYEYIEEDGLIAPWDSAKEKGFFHRSPEYFHHEVKDHFSERTYKFLFEEFYKYLEVEYSLFVKADKMKSVSSGQRDLIHIASRVPGILPSKSKPSDAVFWQSGIFHMDYGFGYDNYKFIIYLNDVEKDEGGVVFTDPIITPYLDDGTRRWEGCQETLKLNVEPKTTDELTLDEKIGKKGTVVCFNAHVAHSARFPKNNVRKAIHLVFKGPAVESYLNSPKEKNPILFEINNEYGFKG